MITGVQVLFAAGLAAAMLGLWYEYGVLDESTFFLVPMALLLTLTWGLWKRRPWGRLLAMTIHWITLAGATALLPLCAYVWFLVPATGIAVAHVFALAGLIVLPTVVLASGWIVWYLHRRTFP